MAVHIGVYLDCPCLDSSCSSTLAPTRPNISQLSRASKDANPCFFLPTKTYVEQSNIFKHIFFINNTPKKLTITSIRNRFQLDLDLLKILFVSFNCVECVYSRNSTQIEWFVLHHSESIRISG